MKKVRFLVVQRYKLVACAGASRLPVALLLLRVLI